jgi:hypothetical protein
MKKQLAFAGIALLLAASDDANAEVTIGVTLGRANQSETTIDSKGLTLAVGLTSRLRLEASLESLNVIDRASKIIALYCPDCPAAQGRALGAAVQYDFAGRGSLQPYLLGAITSEHYILSSGTQERYVRSELGLGLYIKLSSQLQLVGDLRIGQHEVVADATGDAIGDDDGYTSPVLFPNDGAGAALRLGAQIRF